MKNLLLSIFVIITILIMAGYFIFPLYTTNLIAQTLVSESLPGYVPKRIQNRIDEIRKPLNKGTEAMLQSMYTSNISLEQVLEVIDNTREDQAFAMLDDLKTAKPKNTNDVFDVAKEHFTADFDVEVFRRPFNQHFEMKQIRKAIAYANLNRKTHDVDFEMAKAILKKILIQKEKEFLRTSRR